MLHAWKTAAAVAILFLYASTALASEKYWFSCFNYYLGNGISDGTGELFLEALCHGGLLSDGTELPKRCSRLLLADCFKNDDGQLKPFGEAEEPNSDILATCDTSSCAIRKAAGWEGPEMSCYCRDHKGRWKLSTIDLDAYIGNHAGVLECGRVRGSQTCWNPMEQPELR